MKDRDILATNLPHGGFRCRGSQNTAHGKDFPQAWPTWLPKPKKSGVGVLARGDSAPSEHRVMLGTSVVVTTGVLLHSPHCPPQSDLPQCHMCCAKMGEDTAGLGLGIEPSVWEQKQPRVQQQQFLPPRLPTTGPEGEHPNPSQAPLHGGGSLVTSPSLNFQSGGSGVPWTLWKWQFCL